MSSDATYKRPLLLGHETARGRCKRHVGFLNPLGWVPAGEAPPHHGFSREPPLAPSPSRSVRYEAQSLLQKGAQASAAALLLVPAVAEEQGGGTAPPAVSEAPDYNKRLFSICWEHRASGLAAFAEKSLLQALTEFPAQTPRIDECFLKAPFLFGNSPLTFE